VLRQKRSHAVPSPKEYIVTQLIERARSHLTREKIDPRQVFARPGEAAA
jgi:hypothetical protein